ncbi:hypothetical protein L7F22_054851 [Adiantum nelumboides]|nr:hypothetical protein [Adiantum nelumboides]
MAANSNCTCTALVLRILLGGGLFSAWPASAAQIHEALDVDGSGATAATIHHLTSPMATRPSQRGRELDLWRGTFERDKQRGRRLHAAACGTTTPTTAAAALDMPVSSGFQLVNTGSYFARLTVGGGLDPHSRRDVYMIMDTGSDLSWIQCQPCDSCFQQLDTPIFDPAASSTHRNVTCGSPLCAAGPAATWCLPDDPLQLHRGSNLCAYLMTYYDGSTTAGTLITDTLTLGSGHTFPHMAFGCSTGSTGGFVGAAGVLGLGTGALSLPSQLQKSGHSSTFSYCLPPMFSSSNSTLTFAAPISPDTVFTPLVRNPNFALQNHYYIALKGISVGGVRLPIPSFLFQMNRRTGTGGTMVDSGTTITSLPPLAYTTLRNALRKAISANATHLRTADPLENMFDTCYLPKHPTAADSRDNILNGIPSVVLHFARGADLELPPANVFAPINNPGGLDKRLCLSMAPAAQNITIIGNIQQQGIRFTFDTQNGRLGFSTTQTCYK